MVSLKFVGEFLEVLEKSLNITKTCTYKRNKTLMSIIVNLTKLSRVASLISMSRLDMITVGFGDYQSNDFVEETDSH